VHNNTYTYIVHVYLITLPKVVGRGKGKWHPSRRHSLIRCDRNIIVNRNMRSYFLMF
jgi:hypothetical protein